MPTAVARRQCPHGIYVSPRHGHTRVQRPCDGDPALTSLPMSNSSAWTRRSSTPVRCGACTVTRPRWPPGAPTRCATRVGLRDQRGRREHEVPGQDRERSRQADGVLVVEVGEELAFLHPLPVQRLWASGRNIGETRAVGCAHGGRRGGLADGDVGAVDRRCARSAPARVGAQHRCSPLERTREAK